MFRRFSRKAAGYFISRGSAPASAEATARLAVAGRQIIHADRRRRPDPGSVALGAPPPRSAPSQARRARLGPLYGAHNENRILIRRRLAARGESPAAFGRRCIPPPPQRGCRVGDPGLRCVAPRSNTPGIAPHRAQPARWGPRGALVAPCQTGASPASVRRGSFTTGC
jgi:hypothetical protein